MSLSISSTPFMSRQTALEVGAKGTQEVTRQIVKSGKEVNVKNDGYTVVDYAALNLYRTAEKRVAENAIGVETEATKNAVKNAGEILRMVDADKKYARLMPYVDVFSS